MMFPVYVFDLVVAFSESAFLRSWFFPLVALAFIGTVPYIFGPCSLGGNFMYDIISQIVDHAWIQGGSEQQYIFILVVL